MKTGDFSDARCAFIIKQGENGTPFAETLHELELGSPSANAVAA
jgi:hypothetical protein